MSDDMLPHAAHIRVDWVRVVATGDCLPLGNFDQRCSEGAFVLQITERLRSWWHREKT